MGTFMFFLFLISCIGIIVSIILLIKNTVKKQNNKNNKKILIGSIILVIVSLFNIGNSSSKDTKTTNAAAEKSKIVLTTQDKELLKKHYKDFDANERTQFSEIEDKYSKLDDKEKQTSKKDFERMCEEKDIQVKEWEKEDEEKEKKEAKAEEEAKTKKWNDFVKTNSKRLSAGTYTVGKHIAPGNYNVTFNGNGNFIINDSNNILLTNEIGGNYGIKKYKAILVEGSKIELKSMSANFKPIKTTLIPYKTTNIHAGFWVVGTDITKGRYKASITTGGSGNFIVYSSGNPKVNEILGDAGVKEVVIDLEDTDIIDVKNLNNVKLTPEK